MTAKRPRWQYVLMIALALLALATLLVPCMVRTESELRIRASQQGLSLPDGFTSISARMSAASASKALRRKAMARHPSGFAGAAIAGARSAANHPTARLPHRVERVPVPSHWVREFARSPLNLDNPLHMKGFPFIAIIFIFIRID